MIALIRGVVSWIGLCQVTVRYAREPRAGTRASVFQDGGSVPSAPTRGENQRWPAELIRRIEHIRRSFEEHYHIPLPYERFLLKCGLVVVKYSVVLLWGVSAFCYSTP